MESGKKAAGFVTDFDFLIHRIKDEGEDRAGTYSSKKRLDIRVFYWDILAFTHMWQDLEMYKIFDGRTSESDKADFIDACYSCVVQFLVLKDVSKAWKKWRDKKCSKALNEGLFGRVWI